MTRGRARRYLLTKSDESYYPQVVADAGYDVWDWSTLNAGTLFQDSAKTTPASANGDVVGCWTDGVGGVDATQATTANKPTYTTASLNGLPTLGFDGGDILATGDISISTFAVWVVFKSDVVGSRIIYEQSANVGSSSGMLLNASQTSIVVNRSATLSSKNVSLNWANDSSWRVVRHAHNGTQATHTLSINDVLQALSDVAINDVGAGTAAEPLFIGARSGVSNALTGNIAHLCIVSPYPTAEIIAQMESYINGIWGVY